MRTVRVTSWFGIAFWLVAVTIPTAVIAQQWPTRPVKVIVPLGPGSGTDIIGRLFTDRLSSRWNKPVLIENRPGGDGIIGIKAFLTAVDDHVLLFTATSVFTGHRYLHDTLPYDPDDLVPVAQVNDTPVVVAIPTALNVSSLKELVAMAQALSFPKIISACSDGAIRTELVWQ
jgi:tripartite-type tricarboxylate transporter receptor subunit TctC